MIIQYYSDSLGLSRPGIIKMAERYIYLLQIWLKENYEENIFIIDRAIGGATIDKLFKAFLEDDGYIDEKKDILIIHAGICDCAPRPVPLTIRNIISKLPSFIRIQIIKFLHKKRSLLLKTGFVYYNTDKNKFEQTLISWLTKAIDDFKRIYIINIAPTNMETEIRSPGFQKSIQVYNTIIESVVNKIDNKKISLIDINLVITRSDRLIDDLIVRTDGHHLTTLAHKLYAIELIKLEEKYKLSNV